jgi:hypothetical protein
MSTHKTTGTCDINCSVANPNNGVNARLLVVKYVSADRECPVFNVKV